MRFLKKYVLFSAAFFLLSITSLRLTRALHTHGLPQQDNETFNCKSRMAYITICLWPDEIHICLDKLDIDIRNYCLSFKGLVR